MNPADTILVAGIGNIFFGDDAFGCEVALELSRRPLPENVRVIDYGIRSYDLAYALMDNYAATIMVDAVPRGQEPGTVYLIEPDLDNLPGDQAPDGHSMNPVSVLQLARALGAEPRNIYLVGCEPSVLDSEDGAMGLSENVQAAVIPAVEIIEKLLLDLLNKNNNPPPPVLLAEVTER
jgi:hydrogenase maturation protease